MTGTNNDIVQDLVYLREWVNVVEGELKRVRMKIIDIGLGNNGVYKDIQESHQYLVSCLDKVKALYDYYKEKEIN